MLEAGNGVIVPRATHDLGDPGRPSQFRRGNHSVKGKCGVCTGRRCSPNREVSVARMRAGKSGRCDLNMDVCT
jgi:hypothetical protein